MLQTSKRFLPSLAALCGFLVTSALAGDSWPWSKYGLPESTNAACIPLQRTDWAANRHEQILKQRNPDAPLVFLGDSITMMWRSQSGFEGGTAVWEKNYAPLHALNLGISGDTTQNVLWRITEGGELAGLHPKVLVLLIGVNNLIGGKQTPAEVAEGVTAVVKTVRRALPDTRILLLGIFPYRELPTDPARAKVRETNALLAGLNDPGHVKFLDIGDKFISPDGTIPKTVLRDGLHPSEQGYRIWASAMNPELRELLGKAEQKSAL